MSIRETLASWRQDFAYSARSLKREPLVALVIVFTLALGIGANATMFGIIDRLLLRGPEHVVEPAALQRLYITQASYDGVVSTSSVTGYVTYTMLRERRDLFSGVAAYRVAESRVGRGADAREVQAGWATADLFPLLGVKPALGRFFTAEEDRPKQAERVAVLDWGHWQSEYGGARDVLGRTMTLQDEDYTIIGVAPRGFTGPQLQPVEVWLPLSTGFEPHPEWPTTWNARWLQVIARLAPGGTWEKAGAEATRIYRAAAPPSRRFVGEAVLELRPLGTSATGDETREVSVSRWLAGVSLVVLLVACANVTNLLLARAVRRRREVAVRLALGVSRARLARLLLSESLLLAAAGGVLALAFAFWGGDFLRAALLPELSWGAPVDVRVLAFSFVAVLITGIVIGLAPVLQSRTSDLTETLKATSLRAASGKSRLRSTLTVLQAAFSVVLLVGAGLFVRSLWNARNVDLGMDATHVLAVWADYPSGEALTEEQAAAQSLRQEAAQRLMMERLNSHPRVASTARALGVPLQSSMSVELSVPGRDSLPVLPGGGPYIMAVSPSYFETMTTRILRGRGINEGEGKGTEPIVVVNQTMARTLWPGEDALGKCLIIAGEPGKEKACARVVGIAEDVKRDGLRDEPSMQYYVPIGQESSVSGTQLLVRPRGDAAAFVDELRQQLHAIDPSASFFTISYLQDLLEPELRPWRLGATMFVVFGGLALLIAAIGLYSVVAYTVTQRRTELGVRIALGARGAEIVRMVLRQGVGLVAVGVGLGLVIALASGHLLESLLFEQPARDPAVFAGVALTLLLVAVLATWIPALRAGKTSPLEALRTE
jgi:predicted permease